MGLTCSINRKALNSALSSIQTDRIRIEADEFGLFLNAIAPEYCQEIVLDEQADEEGECVVSTTDLQNAIKKINAATVSLKVKDNCLYLQGDVLLRIDLKESEKEYLCQDNRVNQVPTPIASVNAAEFSEAITQAINSVDLNCPAQKMLTLAFIVQNGWLRIGAMGSKRLFVNNFPAAEKTLESKRFSLPLAPCRVLKGFKKKTGTVIISALPGKLNFDYENTTLTVFIQNEDYPMFEKILSRMSPQDIRFLVPSKELEKVFKTFSNLNRNDSKIVVVPFDNFVRIQSESQNVDVPAKFKGPKYTLTLQSKPIKDFLKVSQGKNCVIRIFNNVLCTIYTEDMRALIVTSLTK